MREFSPSAGMAATPPNVALARLFGVCRSEAQARARIATLMDDPETRSEAERMAALWRRCPEAYRRVKKIAAMAREGPHWGEVFDAAAAVDPCTAAAPYSLGDRALLRAATEELVALMRRWSLLAPDRIVLDFGCGTGRIAAAIAPSVARVLGIDVSARMVDVARAAVARHDNAAVIQADSLSALRGDRFDVVLAVDTMPYVVDCGAAAAVWEDVAGLLEPGGAFLIMNYSHRSDPARDADEVATAAARHGFVVACSGTQDLRHWDGRTFLMQKAV